jgi:MFS family permease
MPRAGSHGPDTGAFQTAPMASTTTHARSVAATPHRPAAGMGRAGWRVALAAAVLTGIGLGGRQAFGVFVSPLNTASGLGLATLSLAFALGQLAIGMAQPLFGRLADRAGARRVVLGGAALFVVATLLPVLSATGWIVFFSLVASAIGGSAVGSNALLLGPVSRAATPAHAGFAVGLLGAGMSAGQLVLGPGLQWLIDHQGWEFALLACAACGLLAVPMAFCLAAPGEPASAPAQPVQLGQVLRQRAFWRYAGSFGVCGLHVAFLAVHMPGVIERCGLPASLAGTWIALAGAANIAGSLAVGALLRRVGSARMLATLYLLRAGAILAFVFAPTDLGVLMAFGLLMGATHMATLPPTSSLVSGRYGTARLGSLFGVVMLVHQAGSFLGIWLGGALAAHTGQDTWFWAIDIALALGAAVLVLPRWERAAPGAPAHSVLSVLSWRSLR